MSSLHHMRVLDRLSRMTTADKPIEQDSKLEAGIQINPIFGIGISKGDSDDEIQ